MHLKKSLLLFLISFSTLLSAQEISKLKFYGTVSNEFFYNSRKNVECTDGIVNLFPTPTEIDKVSNIDKNEVPQAEMLSIQSRCGVDINGDSIFGAKSTGKIEADFAGASTTFYVLRIRHAYVKLNWKKTELLIGQTWHPLFGSVMPTTPSSNSGAPFQPFNRSPQVRLKYNLNPSLSVIAAALYQMQYTSQGPLTPSASNSYLKNAILPDFFLGTECRTTHWTSGFGADIKTLKPATKSITSASAVAYTQYVKSAFQIKAKAIYGQNLSDHLMLGGYGVIYDTDSSTVKGYTNINTASSWLNVIYGKKIQVGILIGLSQNLGTDIELTPTKAVNGKKFTTYGYGVYDQVLLNRLYRFAPHVSYNLSNIKVGVEYELTSAEYGNLQSNGRVINPYTVRNNRAVVSMSYLF
ncbi:MAG: hypothetical protein WCG93_14265 [Paludibacter sp.]